MQWTSLLPRSLTELEWTSSALRASDIALLPRTLTSLVSAKLHYNYFSEERLKVGVEELQQYWPPALRSISLHAEHIAVEPSELVLFPPTLTSIRGLVVTSVHDMLMDSPALLPPRLECLEVSLPFNAVLDSSNSRVPLPSSLRELTIDKAEIGIAAIGKLPRELRILRLPKMEIFKKNFDAFIKALPPNLEILQLWKIYDHGLRALPTSIHTLVLWSHPELERSNNKPLPSGLRCVTFTSTGRSVYSSDVDLTLRR